MENMENIANIQKRKIGLIFDMDGTLWDSSQQVAESWNLAAHRLGYHDINLTAQDIRNVMGKTMDVIADILFSSVATGERKELLDLCCEVENEYLREHGGVLYPELRETLEALRTKFHLYIVSNCQAGYIEVFLAHYRLGNLFEDIECYGNNGFQKGRNIRLLFERNELSDAAYVGDIQGDYDATMEAGLKFIHAGYGFGKISEQVPEIAAFSELRDVAASVLSGV